MNKREKSAYLLQQHRKFDKQMKQNIPQVYAAIALALHRSKMPTEDIQYIFGLSQEIWEECASTGLDMVQMCSDEADIELRGTVE